MCGPRGAGGGDWDPFFLRLQNKRSVEGFFLLDPISLLLDMQHQLYHPVMDKPRRNKNPHTWLQASLRIWGILNGSMFYILLMCA